MSRRLAVTLALLVALVSVGALSLSAYGEEGRGGGDGEEHESASGGDARNGQIVFRRYFNAEQTKGALFTMNPDGNHVRQITHPPRVGGTTYRRGLLMERGSPSSASRATRARAGLWS